MRLLTRCGRRQATPPARIYNSGWTRKRSFEQPQRLLLLRPLPICRRWIPKNNTADKAANLQPRLGQRNSSKPQQKVPRF